MAWGNSSNVSTTNLDDGADSPALARQDIKDALDELVAVINGRNAANGVVGLNASGKIVASYLPDEINSSSATDLTLDPATGKVRLEEILNLAPQTTAALNARTNKEAGDVAYASDGDTGSPCIAVYDGSNWLRLALGTAISAT